MPGVQAMFVQGAAAETNPLFQGRTGDKEKDFATMTRMGDLLADEVLKVAGRIPAGRQRPRRFCTRRRRSRSRAAGTGSRRSAWV
jgi:hypothetical protein